jgi:phosphate uptake regulator
MIRENLDDLGLDDDADDLVDLALEELEERLMQDGNTDLRRLRAVVNARRGLQRCRGARRRPRR